MTRETSEREKERERERGGGRVCERNGARAKDGKREIEEGKGREERRGIGGEMMDSRGKTVLKKRETKDKREGRNET